MDLYKILITVCFSLFFAQPGSAQLQPLANNTTSQINAFISSDTWRQAGASRIEQSSGTALLNGVIQAPPLQTSVLLLGDMLPGIGDKKGHWFDAKIKKDGYASFFSEFSSLIKASDIVAGNLEGTLTLSKVKKIKEFRFKGNPQVAKDLKDSGLSILILANNHSFDFGPEGIHDTLNALHKNGLYTIGAGNSYEETYKPLIIDKNGMRFGFMAFSDIGTPSYDNVASAKNSYISEMIAQAKQKVDFLIVSFHWGVEKTLKPTERQIQLAHMAADAGADVVFGHHPHYAQTFEKYNNTLVFYGLGEFIFYRSSRNQEIVSLKFNKNGELKTIDYSIIPIIIFNGKPYYLNPDFGSKPETEKSATGELPQ